jgi:hypothetical protein
MRKFIKYILLATLTAIGFSCADEDLDPLQFEKVKKGTLLALRGSQLDAIYFDGADYGDAFFANNILGNETFDYDAEFLSEDPSLLESVDIFVLKGGNTRVLLTTIPASAFKTSDDYRSPWTSVSLKLTDILTALGEDLSTPAGVANFYKVYGTGIRMESDVNLTDGSKVEAGSLVAAGLVESDQFFPAQKLTYGVEDIDDARPNATLTLSSGVPLKADAKDTLNIVFDQAIASIPVVTTSPADAGTLGAVVRVEGTENEFYVSFVANGSYTGDVKFTVSGATSAEVGALEGLEQNSGKSVIAVDNLPPQNTSFTTGTRLGKGQSAVITLLFNEALGSAPKITIDPNNTGIDGVTVVSSILSADGLTATYTYEYKDLDGNASHGNAKVTFTGGTDKAGNALSPPGEPKDLIVDIGPAPAPVIILDPIKYDWGTLIKWSLTYATGGSNPGGATSGTAYYIAVPKGAAAPTGFVGGDVPAFTGTTGLQTGSVPISGGTSGTVYSAFAPNGELDIYVVFVSSSGVISAISNPTTVAMDRN